MAAEGTRRIVPRQDLEGSLGSGEKRWAKAYIGNVGNGYNTVADMVADLELREGSTVETKGYYTIGDGGNSIYHIREKVVSDVDDGGSIIFLDDGNVAELINNGVVSVKQFGAKGDGVTDNSVAIQNAFNYAQGSLFVPEGVYVAKNILVEKEVMLFGSNAVFKPVYINGIAQNILTFQDVDVKIHDISFIGENHGATDMSVKRQSAVDISNGKVAVLDNVVFDTIDDSVTAWEGPFRQRKGAAITIHDVNDVMLNHVHFNAMGSEEVVWITNQDKDQTDINVKIIDCSSSNMTRLSVLDIIADSISLIRFRSDETDNFQTFSFGNFFGNNVYVNDCTFKGVSYGNIIDTYEAGVYRPKNVIVENCVFERNMFNAVDTVADTVIIKNCYCNGAALLHSTNVVCTNQDIINYMGNCYLTYRPCDSISIIDCTFNADLSISTDTLAYMARILYHEGTVNIINNDCNQNSIKGDSVLVDRVKTLNIEGNNFKNAGLTHSSNLDDNKSFVEALTSCDVVKIVGNVADANNIFWFGLAIVKKLIISQNTIISDTGLIANQFDTTNKVDSIQTDTKRIVVASKDFNTPAAAFSEGSWTASSSSAAYQELTQRITLTSGIWVILVQTPYTPNETTIGIQNFTSNQTLNFATFKGYGQLAIITVVGGSNQSAEFGVVSISGGNVSYDITGRGRIQAYRTMLGK